MQTITLEGGRLSGNVIRCMACEHVVIAGGCEYVIQPATRRAIFKRQIWDDSID
jgi:hypothetical protein